MPKNGQYQIDKPRVDKNKIHPVWRGIGCIMMIVIPAFSYFAALQLVNHRDAFPWVIIPADIVIASGKDPLIFVKLVYALMIALVLFLIMGIITFSINKAYGPKKGPYDVNR
jgi:hypothetical protein